MIDLVGRVPVRRRMWRGNGQRLRRRVLTDGAGDDPGPEGSRHFDSSRARNSLVICRTSSSSLVTAFPETRAPSRSAVWKS